MRARRIAVDDASHSSQIEEIRGDLLEAFASIAPRAGTVPFYSTVTAGLLDTAELSNEYWYRNLRETVQFEGAIGTLLESAPAAFVEVSPHPVLATGVQEMVDKHGGDPAHGGTRRQTAALGTLARNQGDVRRFVRALAEAWVVGVPVDWGAVTSRAGAQRVRLPTYPFQRTRHWLQPAELEQAQSADGRDEEQGQTHEAHAWARGRARADGRGQRRAGKGQRRAHGWGLLQRFAAGPAPRGRAGRRTWGDRARGGTRSRRGRART